MMVQPKPLAGCVDQSSAHLSFLLSSSFILKLCPPDGPFSFPPILFSFSFFLLTNSSQYYQSVLTSTCGTSQYCQAPADRRLVQPQEAAVEPLQAADQQDPADRRQIEPLLAAVQPSPADGRHEADQEEGVQEDQQGGAHGRGEERSSTAQESDNSSPGVILLSTCTVQPASLAT